MFSEQRNRRAVVTWDLLRNTENSLPNVDFVNRWCLNFIRPTLTSLGVEVESVTTSAQGGSFPTAEFVTACGEEPGLSAWTRLFSRTALSRRAEEILEEHFRCELVVGAIPPFLALFLERRSIPFVDIDVDAVRFGKDLFLRARTTAGDIARVFRAEDVPASFLRAEAGLLAGRLAWHGPQITFGSARRVGLFIGQTDVDLSLFAGGVIMRPADFIPEACSFFAECDLVLLSPHPYIQRLDNLAPLRAALPNGIYCGVNTYALLSHPLVTHVCGISSSVLTEAEYFGKRRKMLIEADFFYLARVVRSLSPNYRVGPHTFLRALAGYFSGDSGTPEEYRVAGGYSLRESWNVNYSLDLGATSGFGRLSPGEPMEFANTWPRREVFVNGWTKGDEHGIWKSPGESILVLQAPGAERITLTLYSPPSADIRPGNLGVRVFSASAVCALDQMPPTFDVTLDLVPGPLSATGLLEIQLSSQIPIALRACRTE
jgi:hypothetical protein